jgi:hypothetical protein
LRKEDKDFRFEDMKEAVAYVSIYGLIEFARHGY